VAGEDAELLRAAELLQKTQLLGVLVVIPLIRRFIQRLLLFRQPALVVVRRLGRGGIKSGVA